MPPASPPAGRAADYRSWKFADGPRPVRRPGDPGIDARWLSRRTWGAAAAVGWLLGFWGLVTVGLVGHWGVFGALVAAQLRLFGTGNPILLAIPFLPLAFLPGVVKWLPIDDTTPFRLGVRQAFDATWGPRVEVPPARRAARQRLASRICLGVMVAGGLALAWGAARGYHDATAPHRPLARLGFGEIAQAAARPEAAPGAGLPDAARVDGVVADRSHPWSYRYRVRQDVHVDVYYPLRPPGEAPGAPVRLLELDPTRPDREPAPWNRLDAPGPREGRLAWLDDWTAGRLRDAGFTLAPRVAVLSRWPLHGLDPEPDPIDDLLIVILGATTLIVGGVMLLVARRQGLQLTL